MELTTIIDAESRAKVVLLTIQGKPMEAQLKIITGATQEQFLGCTNYPECQHHEPLPEDRAQAARHAPRLPGVERRQ